MTRYSKLNFIYRLQKWMDSVPGQTFLNYAYSWGASIVILGTLFKLTHLPGANFFLFLGMGTEVFVFFLAAFDRPFDKTTDGMNLDIHPQEEHAAAVVGGTGVAGGGTVIINGGSGVVGGVVGDGQEASRWEGKPQSGQGEGTIVFGSGAPVGAAPFSAGSGSAGSASPGNGSAGAVATGNGSAGVVSPGNVSAGPVSVIPQQPEPLPMAEELKDATSNYIDELNRLTEMLVQVSEQSKRLTRDSEEMENLNRTLTGISRVYEMQLKSASSQIGTIDEINEQTRHMAEQIMELNKIYARMIEAMQVRANM